MNSWTSSGSDDLRTSTFGWSEPDPNRIMPTSWLLHARSRSCSCLIVCNETSFSYWVIAKNGREFPGKSQIFNGSFTNHSTDRAGWRPVQRPIQRAVGLLRVSWFSLESVFFDFSCRHARLEASYIGSVKCGNCAFKYQPRDCTWQGVADVCLVCMLRAEQAGVGLMLAEETNGSGIVVKQLVPRGSADRTGRVRSLSMCQRIPFEPLATVIVSLCARFSRLLVENFSVGRRFALETRCSGSEKPTSWVWFLSWKCVCLFSRYGSWFQYNSVFVWECGAKKLVGNFFGILRLTHAAEATRAEALRRTSSARRMNFHSSTHSIYTCAHMQIAHTHTHTHTHD